MATSVNKKHGKRRRGQARNAKKQSNDRYIKLGLAVIAIGLVAFGVFQFFGNTNGPAASGANSALVAQNGNLESVGIDGDHSTAAQPVTATDRETLYLGPASDSAAYALAEAGQLGQPTLVWFHADW